MPFDPKAYAAGEPQPARGAFDPKAYAQGHYDQAEAFVPRQAAAQPEDRSGQAFLESFGNTATLGYLPHLQALAGKAAGGVRSALGMGPEGVDAELAAKGFKIQQPEGGYVSERDANIKRQSDLRNESPLASGAGTVAGILGGGALTSTLLPAAAGATALGRVGQAAKAGATLGAVQNPGDTEGEVALQVGDRLKNAVIGGVAGGAVQGTLEAASPMARYLRSKAEQSAFKAMGPDFRAVRQNMEKDRVGEIGGALLDEGVISGRPKTNAGLSARAEAGKRAAGEKLDDTISALAAAEPSTPSAINAVDRSRIADELEAELINANSEIPGIAAKNQKVKALIDEFRKGGVGPMPLDRTEALKRSVGKEVKWDRLPGADIPLEEQVQRALYGKLREGAEKRAMAIGEEIGGGAADQFVKAKKNFGALEEASKIIDKRSARDAANRFLSPSDYFTGGLGAVVGASRGESMEDRLKGAALGASLGLAHKGLRTLGPQVNAVAMNNASKAVAALPGLAGASPATLAQAVAAVNGQSNKSSNDPIIGDPDTLRLFQQNPGLIDLVQDPLRRKALRDKLRQPAGK